MVESSSAGLFVGFSVGGLVHADEESSAGEVGFSGFEHALVETSRAFGFD